MVNVDNTDLALKPSMTATTRIIVAQRNDVLRVPDQALRFLNSLVAKGPPPTQSFCGPPVPQRVPPP